MQSRFYIYFIFLLFSTEVKSQTADSLVILMCNQCNSPDQISAGDDYCVPTSFTKEIYGYDSLDNLIYSTLSKKYLATYSYVFEDSIHYTYDSLGHTENYIKYAWNQSTQSWAYDEEYFYAYNSLGGEDSIYRSISGVQSAYTIRTDSLSQLKTVFYWKWGGSIWEPDKRYRHWFNSQWLDTLYLVDEWTGSVWLNKTQTTKTYNLQYNIEESISSNWQPFVWAKSQQDLYSYNASNELILHETNSWQDSIQAWIPKEKYAFEFYTNPTIYGVYYLVWNKTISDWDSIYHDVTTYDSSGRDILNFLNEIWMPKTSLTTKSYDLNGNQISTSYSTSLGASSSSSYIFNSDNLIIHSETHSSSKHGVGKDFYCNWYRISVDSILFSIPDTLHICQGATQQLTGELIYPEHEFTYLWTPSVGLSNDTALLPVFSPQTSTQYYLNIFDSTGIISTYPLFVSIETPNPAPIIDSLISNGRCFPDTIQLFFHPQLQQTYTWYRPGSNVWVSLNDTLFFSSNGLSDSFFVEAIDLNGCISRSDTIEVSMNAEPVSNISSSPAIFCAGDTVMLFVSPYLASARNYQWKVNGIDSIGATDSTFTIFDSGLYSIRVTDQNTSCEYTKNFTAGFGSINQPALIVAFPDTILCANDTTWLSSMYNDTSWNYTWIMGNSAYSSSPSIYAVTGNSYYFRIRVGNCQVNSDTVTIYKDNFKPSISPGGTISLCHPDSVLLQSSQATSYVWSTGETTSQIYVDTSGLYFVSGIDSLGCQNVSWTTQVNKLPMSPPSQISYSTPYLISSINSISLQWYRNDTLIVGATTAAHWPSMDGSYIVSYLDSNGCIVMSDPYYYSILGIGSIENKNTVQLFPNPISSESKISYSGKGKVELIEIYDSKFVQIFSLLNPGSNYILDKFSLSSGLYFGRVRIELIDSKVDHWIKFSVID
ncbi:MAG: hypothetical protein EYC69_12815 [Bacteroidetes bacterium]|nr:MAG: hypothetical protein EYC69_12815 [Bacteroidota bacterium]